MATILLVDDVELFLELERSFLEGGSHHVVTAESGERALEQLEAVAPDLLLLDLYMPGIDGDEVCRRVRAHQRFADLPVIMVTAAGKQEEVRRCLAAGCNDYLTKPVSKKELVEKVDRLLGRVRTRTESRVASDLRVKLRGAGRCLSACVRDISRNGVFVTSSHPLEPGSVVDVGLELPEGREATIPGRVIRVEREGDKGMGIYFVHPEPAGRKVLDGLSGHCRVTERPADAPSAPRSKEDGKAAGNNAELENENRRLRQRIQELETENHEFASQMVRTEELNNNLTNLYVSSSRLHSVLDRAQVLEIIREIVINFIGAEIFVLLAIERETGILRPELQEGLDGVEFPEVVAGDGPLGRAAAECASHFEEGPVVEGSDDLRRPLAVIPLALHGECLGVLAIYRLFIQKEHFEPVDFQLFAMLAEHAATALFCATLYGESERKRQTYRGLMDLLLK